MVYPAAKNRMAKFFTWNKIKTTKSTLPLGQDEEIGGHMGGSPVP